MDTVSICSVPHIVVAINDNDDDDDDNTSCGATVVAGDIDESFLTSHIEIRTPKQPIARPFLWAINNLAFGSLLS